MRRLWPFATLLVVAWACLLAAPAHATAPSAKALESVLLAPCCFGGTLDVHDSPLAHDLRIEIEDRVRRGESTDAIEADLVSRYGPAIRAMPHPGAFAATVGCAMAAIAVGAVLLIVLVRRWSRRAPPSGLLPAAARDGYDDRLDAELEALD